MRTQRDYYDEHECCPRCGEGPFETTTLGHISGTDQNPVNCACGWFGVVHDLVPRSDEPAAGE